MKVILLDQSRPCPVVYGDAPLRSGDGKGGVHAGALTLKLVRDEANVLKVRTECT
jgi:hypothetical protein